MKKQQDEMAKKQIAVLLWLKSLYDFNGEGFEDSTFHEKYKAFEAVEETDEFSREEYNDCVDFWVEKGIIERDSITDEFSITKQGEKLFAMVDSKKDKKAFKIIEKETSDKKPVKFKIIWNFVTQHFGDIVTLLGAGATAFNFFKS